MVSTARHRRDPDSGPGKSLGNIWGGAGEGERSGMARGGEDERVGGELCRVEQIQLENLTAKEVIKNI